VTGQPKIELHVHLEAAIAQPEVPRTAADFRQVLVAYAAVAAGCGARYVEASFAPCRPVRDGLSWETVFDGYCEGVAEAAERHGIVVRLTPDVERGDPVEVAEEAARQAVRYRDRGVVGLGIVGDEEAPAKPYATAFDIARDGGLGILPHAGYVAGPDSVREVLALGADRIRHGIRAAEDPDLLAELADRGIVLDICPTADLRCPGAARPAADLLPALVAAGVRCTVNTGRPAEYGIDLAGEHELAATFGLTPRAAYAAGIAGARCDEATRTWLVKQSRKADWR
jgi:aminodeoxyfutalosine deaminase